ncbi:helix-turn-helix transcriptional regulator [Nocardiopsis sp. YSL2]|uniref:helix-turn-helix transcriptional regulator n=1 Tax=Nocardiopsis sp. YSL2 TaxID=2939492 RepID=UPI0026F41F0E|nr:AraC family transcriptional regulator [Nocardiopsis sp. YSL2]
MEKSVRQAVEVIRSRYDEPLTLSQLAAEVFVSPYHFSRIFSRAVGMTPGRYLTAVRLFAAKRMLLTTDLTVSDIVCSVGYNSVGTFTSRFTRAVGMSPTQYRSPSVSRLLVAVSPDFSRLPALGEMIEARRGRRDANARGGSITGALDLPDTAGPTDVMVGVFREAAPQGAPVAFEAFSACGRTEFTVSGVPHGSHHVIAVARPRGAEGAAAPVLTASTLRHVRIAPGVNTFVSLPLGPAEQASPPLAVTLAETTADQAAGPGPDQLRQTVA